MQIKRRKSAPLLKACAVCADLIDRDNDSYAVDELLRIKDGAEWQASTRAGRPPGSQLPALKTPSAIQRAIEIFCNQEAARQERVDPRFNVAVRLKDGGPVYEYRAKEPVAARLSIHSGGQRQELEVLRTFMDYGGDLSLEGLNVQMEGSPLFPSGDFATRRMHFSSRPRALTMTLALDASAGVPLYIELSGKMTHGTKGLRFSGSCMGDMMSVTMTANYSEGAPNFTLKFNIEGWERRQVMRLPNFARLQQILDITRKAVPVQIQCTYDGIESDFGSGILDGREQFRTLRAFISEVSILRKLDSFFTLNLSLPSDLSEVLRDRGDVSELLSIIDIHKAEDPTIKISIAPPEPVETLHEIITSQRPVEMRLSQPEVNITVFERNYGPFDIDVICPTAIIGTVGPAIVKADVPVDLTLKAAAGSVWSARVASPR